MGSGNVLLWLLGGIATLLGAAIAVPIGLEAYRLAREVIAQARAASERRAQSNSAPLKRGETGPLQKGQLRRPPAYEDRKTVERLIDYFDDDQPDQPDPK